MARIVGEECLRLFGTQATIYSEIMQSMKNAPKQLNTPTWHRQRADKLLAAACRSSEIGGGAHKLTAARRSRRMAHYAHYSQPEEWSPPFDQPLAKAQPFFSIPFIYVSGDTLHRARWPCFFTRTTFNTITKLITDGFPQYPTLQLRPSK